MLEEYDKIDTITESDGGVIQLVIMDAGLTEDPDERFGHLIEKLRSYVAYATSPAFKNEYPETSADRVRILVMCRLAPTERMLSTTSIARADSRDRMIPISYRNFPGTEDAQGEKASVSGVVGSRRRRPSVFYAGTVLGGVTIFAAIIGWFNAGKSAIPGIGIGILFVVVGFVLSRLKR